MQKPTRPKRFLVGAHFPSRGIKSERCKGSAPESMSDEAGPTVMREPGAELAAAASQRRPLNLGRVREAA
jgi:hypothetical protein